MPGETINSPFGHVPAFTTDSPCSAMNIIPSLQFDDGDLVIKLGHEPRDWLIIHTKVFAAVSAVFRIHIGTAWQDVARLNTIKHPHTGEDILVRTLALTIEEGTYMLHEGKDVKIHSQDSLSPSPLPFSESELATGGWPDFPQSDQGSAVPYTARSAAQAYHIFFALVYGVRLDLEQIGGQAFPQRRLVEVCSYAEYWDCFDTIKALVVEAMGRDRRLRFWIDRQPADYAALAAKLGIEEYGPIVAQLGVHEPLRGSIGIERASKEWFCEIEKELGRT